MKKIALLVMASVVYKISLNGYAVFQCQDKAIYDALMGACISTIKDQRVQKDFDSKKSAQEFAAFLKSNKNPAYTITDIHVLSEDGEK